MAGERLILRVDAVPGRASREARKARLSVSPLRSSGRVRIARKVAVLAGVDLPGLTIELPPLPKLHRTEALTNLITWHPCS